MSCAVVDEFDLRGPAGGFHRSLTAQARYAQAPPLDVTPPALPAGRHGRRVPRATGLPALPLPAAVPTLQPCREAPLLICRGGQPPETASWGFNSVSWGFNSAFMVICAGL